MHMSDTLLSPAAGALMLAASAVAVAYSAMKAKKEGFCAKKALVAGAAGAFVLAAQAVNYAIPGTGSSGHVVGGVLLAAMLGAFPAMLAMSAVVTVQCLFLGDGGLLALGANIFNLGVIPCLIAYPLVFRPLVKKGHTAGRIALASVAASVAALQLGAFGVVAQTWLSGITALPFAGFAMLMQPIHLAIGLVDGVAAAVVLCLVYGARPEIMAGASDKPVIMRGVPVRNVAAAFAVVALVAGFAIAPVASSAPDGLEWSIQKTLSR